MPTDISSASATAASVMGNATPSTASAMGSSALGKDEFMKLLLAQLGHQDPTQPVDNQAFIAQLAQFSSVEQLSGINQQLESLVVAQAGANQTAATSLVGKDITFKSDQLSVTPGSPTEIHGTLTGAASKVTATITDSKGKLVSTVNCGAGAQGLFSYSWKPVDSQGHALAAGQYTVKLTAQDANGHNVPIDAQGKGLASGVSFSNGYAELLIGSLRIKLSDVTEIDQPKTGA